MAPFRRSCLYWVQQHPAYCSWLQVIDTMSLELKTQQVFPDCLQFAQTAGPSPNPWERRAAMLVLLVIAEGCAEACSKSMGPILQVGNIT